MTPQMVYIFACMIGRFVNEDWEIIERIVDFKPLEDKEHQGLYGGKAFTDGASKIGSLNKIGSISSIRALITNLNFTA